MLDHHKKKWMDDLEEKAHRLLTKIIGYQIPSIPGPPLTPRPHCRLRCGRFPGQDYEVLLTLASALHPDDRAGVLEVGHINAAARRRPPWQRQWGSVRQSLPGPRRSGHLLAEVVGSGERKGEQSILDKEMSWAWAWKQRLTDFQHKLTVTKGESWGGGTNQEFGINTHTLLHIK